MNRVLSTTKQQRSFTADWLISGDLLGFPQGVIVDLSIVTKSTSPVYLGRLSILSGVLTISFEQDGVVCAYGEVEGDGETRSLQSSGGVLSATVTTGGLSGMSDTIYSPERAQVSPELITVIGNMDEGITTVTVVQDGQETEYVLSEDTELIVSENLRVLYDDITGDAIIGMSDEDYATFTNLVYPIISEPTTLISINNVKSPSGVLSITIETDGNRLPVVAGDSGLLSIDGTSVVLCGTREDPIDSKISPSLHVTGYRPLDDMYVDGVRNTRRVVNLNYGLINERGEFASTLSLTETDPRIDCEEQEGGQ